MKGATWFFFLNSSSIFQWHEPLGEVATVRLGWHFLQKIKDLVLFQLFNNRLLLFPTELCRSSHICCYMSSILNLNISTQIGFFPLMFPLFCFSHNTTPLTCLVRPLLLPALTLPLDTTLEMSVRQVVSVSFLFFLWRKTTGYWKQHEHTTANARLKYDRTLLSASVWRWPSQKEKSFGAHICLDRWQHGNMGDRNAEGVVVCGALQRQAWRTFSLGHLIVAQI